MAEAGMANLDPDQGRPCRGTKCALLWALFSGQYEDLDGDAQRILIDDE
jgi:hypothetical protein